MNFNHLTDEQFTNLLAGDNSDARALLHLEACQPCRNELAALGAAVTDLNFASLRWAERRAAHIAVPSRWALNLTATPGWGATLAAVLILGVALGAHMQTRSYVEPSLQPAHSVSAPSEDELAEDNRLMRSIDSEITEQVPVSDLDRSSHADHQRSLREVSN